MLDMLPCSAMNNILYGASRNPVLEREFVLGNASSGVPNTDVPHRAFGQDRVFHALSPRERAFSGSIRHILRLGSEKQMLGVDAGRIVPARAVMADIHAKRDGAVGQLPCDTVRRRPSKEAVPVTISAPCPYPTGIFAARLVYFSPEPLFKWGVSLLAALRTKAIFALRAIPILPASVSPEIGKWENAGALCTRLGIMGSHLMVLSSGAMPRTVPAVAGPSCASILSDKVG